MTPLQQEYRTIPLTRGLEAKVSPEDYERLIGIKWQAHWNEGTQTYYAHGSTWDAKEKRWRTLVMARIIMGLRRGDRRCVDHISMDTLDNRRSNLRIATNGQNQMNKRVRSDSSTGVKGVALRAKGNYRAYRVCIRANDRRMTVGHFSTLKEAKAAYANAAQQHHGEYARCV